MAIPEIRFVGPEYDGAEAELGTFAGRLTRIIEHAVGQQYGEDNQTSPTDIEVMPVAIEEDRFFVIKAWQETAAPKGMSGVLQAFVGSFDIVINETDAFLHHRVDDGWNYSLTTVETLTLSNLGRLAAAYDAMNSPIGRETP